LIAKCYTQIVFIPNLQFQIHVTNYILNIKLKPNEIVKYNRLNRQIYVIENILEIGKIEINKGNMLTDSHTHTHNIHLARCRLDQLAGKLLCLSVDSCDSFN